MNSTNQITSGILLFFVFAVVMFFVLSFLLENLYLSLLIGAFSGFLAAFMTLPKQAKKQNILFLMISGAALIIYLFLYQMQNGHHIGWLVAALFPAVCIGYTVFRLLQKPKAKAANKPKSRKRK